MKKRLLSIIMIFSLLLTLQPVDFQAFAFGEVGDPIVEGSAAIDILINAGTDSEVLAGDLQDKLYDKLKELLEDAGLDVNVRINTPSVDIDTNDLSEWYVYDHYDPYHQGNTGTVAPTGAVGQINSSTDYSPTAAWEERFESEGGVSDLRPYFKNAANNNFESYTLEKWVSLVQTAKKSTFTELGEFPYTYGTVGSNSQRGPRVTMLGAFDQHIYSRNGIIDFVGYYSYNYNDFLLFPCASKEEKQVTFDIDSSGVNVHSLSSAGFLINTGIYYKEGDTVKTTPYISGYVLCYEYDGGSSSNYVEDPVPDRISLYPIKDGTKAVDFHNNITGSSKSDTLVGKFCGDAIATTQLKDPLGIGTPAGTGSSKKADGAYVTPSLVKTSELCGVEWDSKMNIRLTITPKTLIVEQKPQTSDNWQTVIDVKGDGNQVGSSTTSKTNPVYYSGEPLTSPYNGFGPIVGYTALGHTCQRASQFTYSNIKMAYIDQTDKIFNLLSGANYIQNADLYFIDLTDNGANRELADDGNKAAAYMQAKKIRYITNNPKDELLDDNGKTAATGPLGENGLWMDSDEYRVPVSSEEGADEFIDIDALAEKIAEYILARYGGTEPDYGDDILPLSAPVALLSLVRDVANVTTSYVDIIKRDLIGAEGLNIFGYDIESKPSDGAKIIEYDYEVYFEGTKIITESHTDANKPLLKITNDPDEWPKGEYTVTLKVKDAINTGTEEEPEYEPNKESQAVTVKFHIVEDPVPPLIPTVSISDGKLSFTTSDLGGYGVVGYELVCTPIGNGFSYGGESYTTDDGTKTFQIAASGITAGSQESLQTVENVILPAGEYTMDLVVYDMAGNKTTVKIPVIDYKTEKLTNIKENIVVSSSAAETTAAASAAGTVGIPETWMGGNAAYTTSNVMQANGEAPAAGSTAITITIPARPSAPSAPKAVAAEPDGYKIIDVDLTMEYMKESDESYTNVGSGEIAFDNLTDNYYIRYKAVPGSRFSSYTKTIMKDITSPLVPNVTIGNGELAFTASDIGGYGVVKYELVCTPIGGGFSYGGESYTTDDGTKAFQISTSGITAGSQSGIQTVTNDVLPVGEYEMKLVVYDMAGNKTEVALPGIDYMDEKLIGIIPETSVSGSVAAADGTVSIPEGWMGDDVVYTTTNSVSDTVTGPGTNTTVITIGIPERPASPSTVKGTAIYPNKGKIKGVNNAMEYKAGDAADFTDITGTEVTDLDRGIVYYVRYKAVPGIQFVGTSATPSFNTYTISGSAVNVLGAPLEAMEAEIWLGKNHIAGPEISDENGLFSFDNIAEGIYNLVVRNPVTGEVVTTSVKVDGSADVVRVTVILEGLKNTVVIIDGIENTTVPDIVIEGLPELINILPGENEDGVTPEDLDKVDGGGKLEIILKANAFEEDTGGYEVPVSKLIESASTDERVIGLYLDLTVTKYLWETLAYAHDYDLADETTALKQLPELIKVHIPLDGVANLDGESDLRVYRYHNGESDEIPQDVPNSYREYFELSGNTVILYVRRFSEYAITYADPSMGGVTLTVNKGGIPWSEADLSIRFKGSSNPADQHVITNGTLLQNLKPGVYEIIVNNKNTGKTVTIRPGRDDVSAAINYYTLTLATSTGIGSVTGEDVYMEGEAVTITASAASNYIFKEWTADQSGAYGDLSRQSTTITMPGYDLELTASATFYAFGGGNLSNIVIIQEQGGKATVDSSYPGLGDKVTVTIKPNAGFVLDTLIITDENGIDVVFTDNEDGTYSYRQPVGVVTIDATFKEEVIDTDPGDLDNKEVEESPNVPDETEQGTDETEQGMDETEQGMDETEQGMDETEQGADGTEQEANIPEESDEDGNLVDDSNNEEKDKEPKTGDNGYSLSTVIMLGFIAFMIRMLMDKKGRYSFFGTRAITIIKNHTDK